MSKALTVVLLAFLAFPLTSLAAGAPPAGIRNGASPFASLHEAALQEAVRLRAMIGEASPAQVQPPQRSWASRHPVLMGAMVGAGAGAGITALGCRLSGNEPAIVSCYVWVPIAAGVGGGLGAVIGLIRSR